MKRIVLFLLIVCCLPAATSPGFGADRNEPDGYVFSSYIGRYLFAFERRDVYQYQGFIIYPVNPANRHTVFFVDGNAAGNALKYSRKGNTVIFDPKKRQQLLALIPSSPAPDTDIPALPVTVRDTAGRVALLLIEFDEYLKPEARYYWAGEEMSVMRRAFQGAVTLEALNAGLRQYTLYVVNLESLSDEWKRDWQEIRCRLWLKRLLDNRTASAIAACLLDFAGAIRPEMFNPAWIKNKKTWLREMEIIAADKAVDE